MTIVQARAPSNRSVASLSYECCAEVWSCLVWTSGLWPGCLGVICTYIYVYIHICMYDVFIHTYSIHIYIYIHMNACMHADRQTDRKNIYIHYTYMYVYIYIYIYIYICISISFHANSCGLCRRCIPSKKWYSTDWTPNAPWCVFIRPDETSKLGA